MTASFLSTVTAFVTADRSANYANRVSNVIAAFDAAYEAGAIRKTDFNDFKETINRVIDSMVDKNVRDPFFYAGRFRDVPENIYDVIDNSTIALHTLNGFSKKLAKLDQTNGAVIAATEIVNLFKPYADKVAAAKDMITVRQPKAKETVETYRPLPAGPAATTLVYDALMAFTDAAYEGVLEATKNRLHKTLAFFLKRQQEILDRGEIVRDSMAKAVFRNERTGQVDTKSVTFIYHVTDSVDSRFNSPRTQSENAVAFIMKAAKEHADFVREQFVIKNMKKLTTIVEAKKGLKSVEGNYNTIRLGNLEGDIVFKFEDGTQFTAHNMIVFSTSVLGNDFARFPLTFHNVKFADGSFSKKQSEKQMNEIFPVK